MDELANKRANAEHAQHQLDLHFGKGLLERQDERQHPDMA
jgi:hypothetical protein